jgi:hypothetical protein
MRSNWLVNTVTRTAGIPLVRSLPRLVMPKLDQPSIHMEREDIRVSPTNLARHSTTVIEMAIRKMIAGNYIQRRNQTDAPSIRNTEIICFHMVSLSDFNHPVQWPGMAVPCEILPGRTGRPLSADDSVLVVPGRHPPSPADIGRLQNIPNIFR